MANPLLLDIALYFVEQHLASGDGIDIFRDFTPEEPDDAVVLYEYAGAPHPLHESAVHRSVQVSARSADADTARHRVLQLHNALLSDNNIIQFTPSRWGQVFIRQSPFLIKRDENGRSIYGFNIGITTSIE